MKDARGKLIIRFLCAQTNTKSVNIKKKIYSLLLHEDLYLLLSENSLSFFTERRNKRLDSDFFLKKKIINKNQTVSFLQVKNLISKFRSNKFSKIKQSLFCNKKFQSNHHCDKAFQIAQKIAIELAFESIAVVLLCNQSKKNGSNNLFRKQNNRTSISIQKPLEFLEKEWQYSSFGFKERTNFFFHPEISIRILRKTCEDVSFLHLLRKLVYSFSHSRENIFIRLPSSKIRNILWNIYALEIDDFFVSFFETCCIRKNKTFSGITSSLSCGHKIHDWVRFVHSENDANLSFYKPNHLCLNYQFTGNSTLEISFLAKSSIYKYIRSNPNWFFMFEKQDPWNFLMKRSIIQFFVLRFGYQISKKFFTQKIKNPSFFFLAYILQPSKRKSLVRINTKIFFLRCFFLRKILFFLIPSHLIVLILSKYNFCNSFGLPRSKSGWVTWTDVEIIQQFNNIRESFFFYYKAGENRKDFYRIQYILYLSCCKTLALKHKSNLQQVSKRVEPDFRKNDFLFLSSSSLRKNLSLNSRLRLLYKSQNEKRIWNLQLRYMDSILFFLEELYFDF